MLSVAMSHQTGHPLELVSGGQVEKGMGLGRFLESLAVPRGGVDVARPLSTDKTRERYKSSYCRTKLGGSYRESSEYVS